MARWQKSKRPHASQAFSDVVDVGRVRGHCFWGECPGAT